MIPQIPIWMARAEESSVSEHFFALNKIFNFPKGDLKYGICYALEKYVERFIPKDVNPAGYEIFLMDLSGLKKFLYEEIEDERNLMRKNYFSIILNSSRWIYDIGEELERIEEKHPNWGRYLLYLLGGGGVNCLTPYRLWEEGDRYFFWGCEDDDVEDPEGNLYSVSPTRFRKYYPEWAYKYPLMSCPEDLSIVPEIAEYRAAYRECFDLSNYRFDDFPADIAALPGSLTFPAVIAWTKGLVELENDPAVIASDDEINCFQECEGCNPGAVMFEFLLKNSFQERNMYVKKKLDLFLNNLAKFEKLIDWIKKEGVA